MGIAKPATNLLTSCRLANMPEVALILTVEGGRNPGQCGGVKQGPVRAADELRPKLPKLARFIDDETAVLAYMTFPGSIGPSCARPIRSSV